MWLMCGHIGSLRTPLRSSGSEKSDGMVPESGPVAPFSKACGAGQFYDGCGLTTPGNCADCPAGRHKDAAGEHTRTSARRQMATQQYESRKCVGDGCYYHQLNRGRGKLSESHKDSPAQT